jgi:hypothetical protein
LGENFGGVFEVFYPMIPSVWVGKLARFGKIDGKSAAVTPNQEASVAAY